MTAKPADPPGDNAIEKTLLNWYDMPHYQEPRAPTPLPSAIHAQLYKILDIALTMSKNGDLTRPIAATMLKALAPVVRHQEERLKGKAAELHFSAADAKLADKIESLLLLGGEGEYGREEISNYLHRNRTSEEITQALALLRRSGRALSRDKVRFPGHKPAELWRLTRDSDFRYPPPPPDAGLPPPPQMIYGGIVRHRPPGVPLDWGEDTPPAVMKPPPIWDADSHPDDPRTKRAVARWEARQRGEFPRVTPAETRTPRAAKRARWE